MNAASKEPEREAESGIEGIASHTAAGPGEPLIVFDFDGTLVGGDSFTGFCVRYCRRSVPRLALCLLVLPLVSVAFLSPRTRRFSARVFLWALTLGVPTRQLVRALRDYAEGQLLSRVDESTFRELERWQAQGAKLVIATGTLPILVRTLLDRRRLRGVRVIGSRLARRWGGLTAAVHCVGPAKVAELERWLGVRDWAWAYTDSSMDLPLMQRATSVMLVGASARTERRVRRRLGARADVHVWSATPPVAVALTSKPAAP